MTEESSYSHELVKLLEKGAQAFAEKQYEKSVEYYSEACEKSNLLTGRDDPDLLFLYAKSLFENAVSKSEVFGGQNNQEEKAEETEDDNGMFQFNEQLAENEEYEEESEQEKEEQEEDEQSHVQEHEQGEEGEEQTDFEVSWEILDLTRTLYEEQLNTLQDEQLETPYLDSDKKDIKEISSPFVAIKKKLSEVYDLLGEISLETENFSQAAQDFTTLANLRTELYPFSSRLVSEAYYKLSLASEFNTGEAGSSATAVEAMEKSLKSIKERYELSDQEKDESLLQEMEQRLDELRKGDAAIREEKKRIMMGILGEGDGTEIKATPKSVPVNDLTGMVKKRKQPGGKAVTKKAKTSK
ncbi:hypothetical protein KL930_001453 [Ogataea haglerorum]|nr:hypothetical protein KL951_001939 [Ogataea haglerorum]KAG7767848.1 hypothetical protein KL931_003661 [Ogataea haglerorum]KAG7780528.1 hypothetical protein KL922_000879 [Ogataea haglerorum]KAG7781957.1 hypothetical protein KL930_001453 [Ogataea haglerorum]